MPWIEPRYLECAAYLYPSITDAENGSRIGGSGFVVGIDVGKHGVNYAVRPQVLCIVTNKHVIDGGNKVVRINTITGGGDIIPLNGVPWYTHSGGDDLAVCPVKTSFLHKATIYHIPSNSLITKKIIEDYDIGPGDDVFVVGRFVNHEGKQRNLPSARFGNIAQMPWEPIEFNGFLQESFLVEARSIAGYSGSPVFVFLPPAPVPSNLNPEIRKRVTEGMLGWPGVSKKRFNLPIPLGPWLLGVDYCHIHRDERIWNRRTKEANPDWFVRSNTGMMGVVPAWKLAEILEGADLKPLVDEVKDRIANAAEGDAIDFNAADFGRFVPQTAPAPQK
jgi:Trypsin-like peptidase domain